MYNTIDDPLTAFSGSTEYTPYVHSGKNRLLAQIKYQMEQEKLQEEEAALKYNISPNYAQQLQRIVAPVQEYGFNPVNYHVEDLLSEQERMLKEQYQIDTSMAKSVADNHERIVRRNIQNNVQNKRAATPTGVPKPQVKYQVQRKTKNRVSVPSNGIEPPKINHNMVKTRREVKLEEVRKDIDKNKKGLAAAQQNLAKAVKGGNATEIAKAQNLVKEWNENIRALEKEEIKYK